MNSETPASSTAWPLVALAASLWGTDILLRPPLIRAGLSATMIVLAEHLLLGLLFLPVVLRARAGWAGMTKRQWLGLVYIAWAGSAVATTLLTQAYAYGAPLLATLLQKTQPVFAVALAGTLLGERRKASFWAPFAGAVAAAYLLSFGFMPVVDAFRSPSAPAALCALGAAALWGSCTVVGRGLPSTLTPAVTAGLRFLLAIPPLLAVNLPHAAHSGIPQPIGSAPLAFLALIVLIPDVLGMTLYYAGLRRTPASVATLAELAYPVSALILGLLFGHQRLSAGQWCGLALLLVSLQAIGAARSVRIADLDPLGQESRVEPRPVQST